MQKVSKVKRFIAMTAMAAMLSITGLGAAQNSAQANTKDEAWSFSLAANSYGFISLSQDQRRMIQKFIFIGVVHMEVI